MRMVFLCGYCRGKLAADSSNAGSPVKCPRCQAVVEAPAPEDPGYEFVEEPEPEVEPPPPRERELKPVRKSSRRLVRDVRPIRRRSGGMSNGTKAALLGLLGLAAVGVVVILALFAFSGGKIDPKKGGIAQGGGLLPGVPGVEPDGKPTPPPNWQEIRHGKIRLRVPPDADISDLSKTIATRPTVVEARGYFLLVWDDPRYPRDAAPMTLLSRQHSLPFGEIQSVQTKRVLVSGRPADEVLTTSISNDRGSPDFGRKTYQIDRWMKVGDGACSVSIHCHSSEELVRSATIRAILDSFEVVP